MVWNNGGNTNMRCPSESGDSADLLVEYCAGTLNRETVEQLEEHLAICPACRSVCEAQKATWDVLDVWEPGPVPADFNRKVLERIEALNAQPWWKRWLAGLGFSGWRPVAAVAMVAGVLAVVLVLRPDASPPPPPAQTKAASSEKLDPDQLEQALDDMDMLQHLSASSGEEL